MSTIRRTRIPREISETLIRPSYEAARLSIRPEKKTCWHQDFWLRSMRAPDPQSTERHARRWCRPRRPAFLKAYASFRKIEFCLASVLRGVPGAGIRPSFAAASAITISAFSETSFTLSLAHCKAIYGGFRTAALVFQLLRGLPS